MTHARLGPWRVRVPASPVVRVMGGVLLIVGGVFGILPVLGYWMIPAGLVLLSFDFPVVRRWRRRMEVGLLRWWRGRTHKGQTQKDEHRNRKQEKEDGTTHEHGSRG